MVASCREFLVLALSTSLWFAPLTAEHFSYTPSVSQLDWRFESNRNMSGGVRAIVKKVLSVEQAEGVGARVRRSVGRPEVGPS